MVRIVTYYHSYESCKVCVIVCKMKECHIKNTVWSFLDATCLNQNEFTMYVITMSSISIQQTSFPVEVVWFVLFLKMNFKRSKLMTPICSITSYQIHIQNL